MTGGVVHVSQDLSSSDSNTVGSGVNSLGDMTTKLETGRHVSEQTGLMSEVDELESLFEVELENLYHQLPPTAGGKWLTIHSEG
jgi:hypothetical protein